MDGGAWRATVYGVAKSQTRLSNFTTTSLYYDTRLPPPPPKEDRGPPHPFVHLINLLVLEKHATSYTVLPYIF